ncbi:NAD(P)-binding oxidoreductase [Rahnella woolbedingensis]|uniref:NAD(P)-dependent oxidoreductase n=1 Tax=Rahnella woolbedingensis TaxID=1510574 RepID=A0A419N4C0_9GAMM|nr:NAD(P)-binding oxidoreductase [Rahnella woolbedingensis]RJT39807.1 NAD(P)-dependent oxidoreductase [Rahnella woolbedingensis]
MNTLLIFGAGSGVGAELVALTAQERPVVALIRNAEQAQTLRALGVTVIEGDALDPADVLQACGMAGSEAQIVSTLGGKLSDYTANRLIIDTAEQTGIRQMLLVTSIGCGDSWPTLSARAKQAFGQAVREKSLAESWLQTSTLDWCILRPGGLMNGDATGKAHLIQTEAHGRVRRSDVALHIQQLLASGEDWGEIFALCDSTLEGERF